MMASYHLVFCNYFFFHPMIMLCSLLEAELDVVALPALLMRKQIEEESMFTTKDKVCKIQSFLMKMIDCCIFRRPHH